MKTLHIVIIFLFILLFLYTGISKLWQYNLYVTEIRGSPLLRSIPISLAWVLPALEIIVAFMMIARRWRLLGLYSCCILMTLFTIYLIALSRFDDYIPCSCGGFLDSMPRNMHIVVNCVLASLAVFDIALEKKQKRLIKSNF